MPAKKFKLLDAILVIICVVFVAEAAAPAAAIGNSQFFWWFFLIITFLLPYGLIAAELGTTYEAEGGLYDWVNKAYGSKWASRTAWYYWVNYPLWMASLAVLFSTVIGALFATELPLYIALPIELSFVWLITWLSHYKAADSKWILNGSAVIKVFLALLLGGLGVYAAFTKGVVTEYTFASLVPSFDIRSLAFVSVILFNFMGFEVINSFYNDMQNPQKQLPMAIIIGGLVIAAIYIFSAFGISAAIPADQIGSNGLIESIQMLTGSANGIVVITASVLFLLSLVGNMLSWAFGVNYVANYAAKDHSLPKIFAKNSKKTGMPTGAAMMNGIVATILLLIVPIIPSSDLFWSFFALNIVTLLLSYVPLFPAFLKLRTIDPQTPRPFKVPGGPILLKFITFTPVVLLIISIIFTVMPLNTSEDELMSKLPLLCGVIVAVIIGEIVSKISAKQKLK